MPPRELGFGASLRAWFHRLAIAVIAASLALVAAQQLAYVGEKGDQLSDFADNNSESNAIRAGESYARRGFTHNYGLPDIAYGRQFTQWGAKIDLDYCGHENGSYETCVYQHYPPGPDFLVGVMTRFFGAGRAGYFRLFPVGLGILCLGYFAVTLFRLVGPVRAALLFFVLCRLPVTQNMMHGLHYQGYALSLLLVQIAVLMRLFLRPADDKEWHFLALYTLGHLQGWLSFDYCFLVTFCALPIWLLAPEWRSRLLMKRVFMAMFLAGLGFTVAHTLHFMQVMLYRGDGFRGLVEHFKEVARARSGVTNWDAELAFPGLFGLFVRYWTVLLPKALYFDLPFPAIIAGVIAFFLAPFRRIDAALGPFMLRVRIQHHQFAAVLAALAVSSLWLLLMRTHAFVHQHFLPRHYYLGFFVSLLAVLVSISIETTPETSDAQ